MTGFGTIVKSIVGLLDAAGSAAIFGLRLALGVRQPRPCAIPVEAKRLRR